MAQLLGQIITGELMLNTSVLGSQLDAVLDLQSSK